MPVPVLSAAEAAAWDAAARMAGGIPSRALMDAAGRAAAQVIATAAPVASLPLARHTALVACGPGNNGGDGWVVARALRAVGWQVWASDLDRPRSPDNEANRTLALAEGVTRLDPTAPWPDAAVVVDALLGTGAVGPPSDEIGALATRIASLQAPIVALDGPTGLDLTTGVAHGPVRADLTVTFGGVRRGHLFARDWCGDIVVVDIGFPAPDPTLPWLVTDRWVAEHLPPITSAMHKGDRGRILVVGGAVGMAGAVIHAARAAFAAGAGLVKLAVAEASVSAVQANLPDALVSTDLDADIAWADAIVLGPGIGRDAAAQRLVERVVTKARVPIVLDADALHQGGMAKGGKAGRVLTPHPGEFAAQFPGIALDDPYDAVTRAAATCGASTAVLLKGVPTVIAATGAPLRVVARGNAGLATGGSGDILAGLIAMALARGLAPDVAAALGAHVLGRAVEIAATHVPVRSMRPDDVLAALPDVWRDL
ncbi:MAG: NAD(P)H-hydrate dehydratase, partial [Gemmatimonadales bacterium]